jgi:hypothetical protein
MNVPLDLTSLHLNHGDLAPDDGPYCEPDPTSGPPPCTHPSRECTKWRENMHGSTIGSWQRPVPAAIEDDAHPVPWAVCE